MAQMVEVGTKSDVVRFAVAEGYLRLQQATLEAIRNGTVKKGMPFEVAKVAAIQAVKDTPRIVPLCHPIPVTGVEVELEESNGRVRVACKVSCDYKTGVEMEALTGVSAALLTVWDMVKYLEKDQGGQYPSTCIEAIQVIEKYKGEN